MPSPPQPATTWKPLIVCPHSQMAQRILAAAREVSAEASPPLAEYPRMGALAGMLRQTGCNICFVDVASNPEHAQVLIAEAAPEVPVVALHSRADADLILRCLRRGACEFLTEPTGDALRSLFDRLSRARSPAAPHSAGAVYCIAPGKPGCGASTVAAHAAIRLAAGGSNTLLVDGDALGASIAFLLKLKPEFHLGDVVRDWKRMDQDLWSRLTVHAYGVDVLCAPEHPAAAVELPRELAGELCAFWRERYDTVVVDLPDAGAAAQTGLAALADTTLLVTTNELAALQATRRAMELLERSLADRSRLRLLINRYTPATGLKRDDVKTALGVEPYAILANDYEALQQALLDGKPAPPTSRFTASVEALCRQLQNRGAEAHKNGSWLSLLRSNRKPDSVKS
ncbi:MAG TPA: P-loop NTPase [Candidatus Sulfopaludibacter sp.]|nr:P-loop NTPase [Candidatus Sulfopaludibacter sp.]